MNSTKLRKTKIFAIGACVLFGAICVGVGTNSMTHSVVDDGDTAAIVTPTSDPVVTKGAPSLPTPGDFKLRVKTKSKDCFGSAGCNVQYEIAVTMTKRFDVGQRCDVTYEVRGLEDPQVGTLTIDGSGLFDQDLYQAGSTSSSSKKLTAAATEVSC